MSYYNNDERDYDREEMQERLYDEDADDNQVQSLEEKYETKSAKEFMVLSLVEFLTNRESVEPISTNN